MTDTASIPTPKSIGRIAPSDDCYFIGSGFYTCTHIVKAVKCHEELRAALLALHENITAHLKSIGAELSQDPESPAYKLRIQVETALANSEAP